MKAPWKLDLAVSRCCYGEWLNVTLVCVQIARRPWILKAWGSRNMVMLLESGVKLGRMEGYRYLCCAYSIWSNGLM